MKLQIKNYVLVTFFALITMFSCQNEETEIINPQETETIEANSVLANVMRSTSANSVSRDNILDNSDCFSVDLPVTVVVSNITITITTEADLEELEDLLEDLEGEVPEFVFPITIIYSDYDELVIENQDQLDALLEQCFEENDTIECVDFIYPISFSVFNSEFILVDTITIENDEALYDFLERLEDESETLIVSLNFPVSLEYANGDTTTVNSNAELADAIAMAGDDCEDDDYITCSVDDIKSFLKECSWILDDVLNDFDGLEVTFNDDFTFTLIGESIDVEVTGSWTVEETDNGTYLVLSELSAFQEDLGGEYLITECNEDDFELIKGDFELDLDRNCESDINCSAAEITDNLRTCYWYAASNSLNIDSSVKLKFTENYQVLFYNEDTSNFDNVGTWEVTVVGMERKVELILEDPLSNISGIWSVVECEEGFIGLENDGNILHLEQECFDANPFECYPQEMVILEECDEDNDGFEAFNIYEAVPNCNPSEPVSITFHTTLSGVENNTDYLENATNYVNTSDLQIVYVKVALFNNPEEYIYYEVKLVVADCGNDPFACYPDEIVELEKCDDNQDGYATFNIYEAVPDCNPSEPVAITFHTTLSGVENNTDYLEQATAYTNTSNPQIVYVKVALTSDPTTYHYYEVKLTAINC